MLNIENEKCIGCGKCMYLYPDIIRMNELGFASIIKDEKIDITCCPTNAIIFT